MAFFEALAKIGQTAAKAAKPAAAVEKSAATVSHAPKAAASVENDARYNKNLATFLAGQKELGPIGSETSAAGELITSGKMLDAASVKKENLAHEIKPVQDEKPAQNVGETAKPASKWWDYANKAGIIGGVAGLGVTGWQLVNMGKSGSGAAAQAADVGAAGTPLTQAGSMSAYGSPVVAAPTMQGLSSGAGPVMQPNYAGQAAMGNAGMTSSEIGALAPFVAPPTETFPSHPMNFGMGGGISGVA